MSKIKVQDLLIKIANKENLPKKIKFENYVYDLKYDENVCEYRYKHKDCTGIGFSDSDLMYDWNLCLHLNDEIEIIEEPKKIEPFTKEEMEIYSDTPAYIEDLAHKVSLLIDVVNEMRKENE